MAPLLLWRLSIPMNGCIKRPSSPSIELVTRPGESLVDVNALADSDDSGSAAKKEKAPSSLDVVLRDKSMVYYAVYGLRLPAGVDRHELVCCWRVVNQAAVIEAPWHGDDGGPNDGGGVLTGVELNFGGFMMGPAQSKGLNDRMGIMYSVHYEAVENKLCAGFPADLLGSGSGNILFGGGGPTNVKWQWISLRLDPIAFRYGLVAVEEAAKLQIEKQEETADDVHESALTKKTKDDRCSPESDVSEGGGEGTTDDEEGEGSGDEEAYRQYWFHAPLIKVRHVEESANGAGRGGFGMPNPYASAFEGD